MSEEIAQEISVDGGSAEAGQVEECCGGGCSQHCEIDVHETTGSGGAEDQISKFDYGEAVLQMDVSFDGFGNIGLAFSDKNRPENPELRATFPPIEVAKIAAHLSQAAIMTSGLIDAKLGMSAVRKCRMELDTYFQELNVWPTEGHCMQAAALVWNSLFSSAGAGTLWPWGNISQAPKSVTGTREERLAVVGALVSLEIDATNHPRGKTEAGPGGVVHNSAADDDSC